jgi:hypothetical protein
MFAGMEEGPGIPVKRFNECMDKYLTSGEINPDILYFCDARQQDILNEVKKSLVRLKNKK